MQKWIVAVAGALMFMLGFSACGSDSTCIGTGGVIDSCKEGWTEEECAEWDQESVNGSDWTITGGSCAEHGYTAECPDGTFLKPADASSC